MKKILFICFLFIGVSGFSQEADADFKAKTIELIKLSSGPQFEVMLEPVYNMVPAENKEAFKAELQKSLEGLYDDIAVIYMESYTEEDVDAILDFYRTPIGQKMLAQTPKIMEKSMRLGQQWGMQLQPLIQKYSK
ncbi:MAG TPA: DUF2059 domain-containing protein [Salinimicrobium sp.]|nr:DUF2059 domain-containing protein [Salinimicrobium sp.]